MMQRREFVAIVCGAAAARRITAAACASPINNSAVAFVSQLPLYTPQRPVSGTIRLWGHGSFKHDFMGPLVHGWMRALNRHLPGVTLDFRMYGTASAVGALVTGSANLAILGEEISPAAARAFERARGYSPTLVQVATGSLDVNFFDYAHMIFVHRDNPLTKLDLTQLDAIYGQEHRRGERNIRLWGELGLPGDWAQRRIQPYGWKVDEDFALFFSAAVLEGSHRWNSDIREYVHQIRADGSQYDHGQRILDALAQDRYGIAISNLRYAVPEVKSLALAAANGGAYFSASPETLISQEYPLTRIIPAVVDRAPGAGIEPVVREFLRFVLSREGQQTLLTDSCYLPLGSKAIRAQLERLQ